MPVKVHYSPYDWATLAECGARDRIETDFRLVTCKKCIRSGSETAAQRRERYRRERRRAALRRKAIRTVVGRHSDEVEAELARLVENER